VCGVWGWREGSGGFCQCLADGRGYFPGQQFPTWLPCLSYYSCFGHPPHLLPLGLLSLLVHNIVLLLPSLPPAPVLPQLLHPGWVVPPVWCIAEGGVEFAIHIRCKWLTSILLPRPSPPSLPPLPPVCCLPG
jgi:hypothetical protein